MFVLITYDVNTETPAGRKRLRQIAKACQNHGQRVQNSVFECMLEPAKFADLKHQLITIANSDTDSLRFYHLGNNWRRRVDHYGAKPSYDPEGPLII